jgi:hypothetical protein
LEEDEEADEVRRCFDGWLLVVVVVWVLLLCGLEEKEEEERGRMSQAQCSEAYEVVEVAESRESERDMATEAGAKVEERMLEVGEEKKCMVAMVGGCSDAESGVVNGVRRLLMLFADVFVQSQCWLWRVGWQASATYALCDEMAKAASRQGGCAAVVVSIAGYWIGEFDGASPIRYLCVSVGGARVCGTCQDQDLAPCARCETCQIQNVAARG